MYAIVLTYISSNSQTLHQDIYNKSLFTSFIRNHFTNTVDTVKMYSLTFFTSLCTCRRNTVCGWSSILVLVTARRAEREVQMGRGELLYFSKMAMLEKKQIQIHF